MNQEDICSKNTLPLQQMDLKIDFLFYKNVNKEFLLFFKSSKKNRIVVYINPV